MLTDLSVAANVPQTDIDFLAEFYQPNATAQWQLSLIEGCYRLDNKDNSLSLALDFRSGNYRHRNNNLGKEPLIQAVKIKKKLPETLIDTTPGVLKDSFMLAARGIHITAIERNPLLYVMVKRALSHVESPINYLFGDAAQQLANHNADVIYIDPMYPPKRKSAQVKKDMQVLHQIIGADADAAELLLAAKQQKTNRIVVKRPNYAEPLGNEKPSFISQTGATRFDVYLSVLAASG